MTETTTVLIGFADALAAIESCASLQQAGYRVVVFARRGTRPPLRYTSGVEILYVTAPEQDAAACAHQIGDCAKACNADVFLPLDDASVHLAHEAELEIPIAGPSQEQIAFVLDKRIQLDIAKQAGLSVPETVVLESATAKPPTFGFPAVLKPAHAIRLDRDCLTKGEGAYCADAKEWNTARRDADPERPLLAQPFLRGAGEGIFGFAAGSEILAWSAHRRLRMMNPHGSGSSACESAIVDGAQIQPITRFLQAVQWQGLFMIELLRDDNGRAWFVEINGRTWGSMALARRLGFEYPAWAVQFALDPKFRPPIVPAPLAPLRCRHLGRELVHLAMVLRGPQSRAFTRWPSRWRTLTNVLWLRHGESWYNWRRGGVRTFFSDAWQTLARRLFRRRR